MNTKFHIQDSSPTAISQYYMTLIRNMENLQVLYNIIPDQWPAAYVCALAPDTLEEEKFARCLLTD